MSIPEIKKAVQENDVLKFMLLIEQYDLDWLNKRHEDLYDYPLIVYVTVEKKYDFLQILIDKGVDVDATDTQGATSLSISCEGLDDASFQMLLDAGANTSLSNARGYSPLNWAVRRDGAGDTFVNALLAHGADVTTLDKYGHSILDKAVIRRNQTCVDLIKLFMELRGKVYERSV